MRIVKIITLTLASLLGILVVLVAASNLLPGEQYKRIIASMVESSTGRQIAIDGDFDVELTSRFRLTASDVRFQNADWASPDDLLSLDRIEIEVPLSPLMDGVLDVRLVLLSPNVLLETDADGMGNWAFPKHDADPEAEDSSHDSDDGRMPLRPFLREIRIEQARLRYRDGVSDTEHSATLDQVLLSSQDDEVIVSVDGKLDDYPLQLQGGLENAVITEGGPAPEFNLSGDLAGIRIKATGILSALSLTANADLQLSADASSIAVFSTLAGRELPALGPVSASARIASNDQLWSLTELDADLTSESVKAKLSGGIADLAAMSDIGVTANLETDQLPEIAEQLGIEVPVDLPPGVTASATISGSLDALALSNYVVDVKDEGITLNATGQVDNLLELKGVSGNLLFDAVSLTALSKFAGTELPELGALKASAVVASQEDSYSLSDIKADLTGRDLTVTLEAAVQDLLNVKGIDAKVNATSPSLASLDKYLGQELPDTGPISFSGTIANEEGLDAPTEVSGSLKGEGVRASFDGSIEDIMAAKGVALAINLEGESLQQIAKLGGQELDFADPVALKGRIYLGTTKYKADDLTLKVGDSEFTGALVFALPEKEGQNARLSGALHLGTLDLVPFVPRGLENAPVVETSAEAPAAASGTTDAQEPAETGLAPAAPAKEPITASEDTKAKTGAKARVIPDFPLPVDLLRGLDVDIEVTADQTLTRELVLNAFNAKVLLENGVLTLDPVQGQVGQGALLAEFVLDASATPASLTVDVNLDNGTTRYFGGRYGIDANVAGKGNSLAELMGSLDGSVIVDARDLEMEKSAMTQFGRGLFDTMNPFDEEKESSELVCGMAHLIIEDGIVNADDRLVAQMTNVTWFGGGTINLKTEEISIGAQPKPRKGLGIQSLGGLASLVYVDGTLAEPRIQLNPKDVAIKYGQHTLTVATGGLWLVAKGLWDKSKANSDVCAEILAKAEETEKQFQEAMSDEAQMTGEESTPGARGADCDTDEAADNAEPSILDDL